jgi:hypothetical protein
VDIYIYSRLHSLHSLRNWIGGVTASGVCSTVGAVMGGNSSILFGLAALTVFSLGISGGYLLHANKVSNSEPPMNLTGERGASPAAVPGKAGVQSEAVAIVGSGASERVQGREGGRVDATDRRSGLQATHLVCRP